MDFYRCYLENDGNNVRGSDGSRPRRKKETDKLWWSPDSPWVVLDRIDSTKNVTREVFNPHNLGDHTFRVYFFVKAVEKDLEVMNGDKLLADNTVGPKCEPKKKRVSKKKGE